MGTLLTISVFAPLAGVLIVGRSQRVARQMTLIIVLITTAISGWLAFQFPVGARQFAVFEVPWWSRSDQTIGLRLALGLDGLSVWLYALTSLLTVTSVLVSWNSIDRQAPTFYRLLLVLYTGMLGVFTARDLLLFYVFFEATLIPLFFLIGIWGHEDRRHAAVKFFVFTLAGSVLTFLGLLALVIWTASYGAAGRITFSIPELSDRLSELRSQGLLPLSVQLWIFWALFIGFAVKVPLVPLHTWLPLAHVEAPTAGSVLLAGILLKVGGYGFLRLVLPLAPDAVHTVTPWLLAICVVGIVYGAFTAFAQRDIKRLIAYSSVSHLGFCMLGVFCLSPLGLHGGLLQMINHGLATGGLFAVVGMLYERYHTRKIEAFGGLARKLPVLAFMTFVLTFSSIGLPGLNGFVGEILVLIAMFQRAWTHGGWEMLLAVLATSGVVLGAWYMLTLVGRVFFGPLVEPLAEAVAERDGGGSSSQVSKEDWQSYHVSAGQHGIQDLNLREIFALAPLFVFIVWIGICPNYFLQKMTPALRQIERSMAIAAQRDNPLAIPNALTFENVPPHSVDHFAGTD